MRTQKRQPHDTPMIIRKEKLPNGARAIYFCGIRLYTYRRCRNNVHVHGKGNEVYCADPANAHLHISIFGDNNVVNIHTTARFCARIAIGTPECPANGCRVEVGADTTANELGILLMEDNSAIRIGADCMFASGIMLWGSDTHTLLDAEGRVANIGKSIDIGEHCWVGQDCKILKNTALAPHCVLGMGSILTTRCEEPQCILAGIPAKVVKRGMDWDRRRPQQWLRDHAE